MNPKKPDTAPSELFVATFVPSVGPDTAADHIRMAEIVEKLFGLLCMEDLDVPSELWVGHTGTGQSHGGTARDCVMNFHVKDLSRALEIIKQGLADSGIPPDHFEIVGGNWPGPYPTLWPQDRTAQLAGRTDEQLLQEIRKRIEPLNTLVEESRANVATALKTLEDARSRRTQSEREWRDISQKYKTEVRQLVIGLESWMGGLLRSWPAQAPVGLFAKLIAWRVRGLRNPVLKKLRADADKILRMENAAADPLLAALQVALKSFMASAWDSDASRRAAVHALHASIQSSVRSFVEPPLNQ